MRALLHLMRGVHVVIVVDGGVLQGIVVEVQSSEFYSSLQQQTDYKLVVGEGDGVIICVCNYNKQTTNPQHNYQSTAGVQ